MGTEPDHKAPLQPEEFDFLRYMYPDYRPMFDREIEAHWRGHGRAERRMRNWKEAADRAQLATEPLPDRFRESTYLLLNPDLADDFSAPHAARWHYLAYGREEGRIALRPAMTEEASHLRTYRVFDPVEVRVDPEFPTRVNVLVPGFETGTMSAGFFGVFEIASWLERLGHRVRLVFFENFPFYIEDLRASLVRHGGLDTLLDRVEVAYVGERRSPLSVSPNDTSVATVWYSAFLAQHIQRQTDGAPFLYLIQDEESHFHPAGSASVLARQSYAMDFHALVSSASLLDHMRHEVPGTLRDNPGRGMSFNNAASHHFDPAVALAPRTGKRTLVFYARPMVDRNAFDIGIEALRQAVRRGVLPAEEWEFVGIGIGDMDVEIDEGVYLEQLPRMAIDEYREQLGRFDLALSLMISPHPSLVPIDLAGSGVPVVTNVHGRKTPEYLAGISSLILPSELDIPSLVSALGNGSALSASPEARRRGAEELRWPTSWSEVFTDDHVRFVNAVLGQPARA